jgi:hypothetical protein
MSFVIAAPDVVQGAAQSLAGIRSSLAQATTAAAGPTTGIAAAAQDEVSIAIAGLFGNHAQEFQALSAQAQGFHAQFVTAMNGSAAAYVGAEAANAGQILLGGGVLGNIGQNISGAVAGGQAAFGQLGGQVGGSLTGAMTALQTGSFGALASAQVQGGVQAFSGAMATAPTTGAATVAQGISSFGAAVAAPYQQLVINTNNNLAAINQTYMANPHPLLTQVMTNQTGFAQTFGSGVVTSLQGFPGNVSANIQLALQGASTFNPAALAQQFITQQQGYAFTIGSSLQLASQDLMNGAPAFQAGVQAAFQDLLVGNNVAAYGAIQQGLQSLLLPGFDPIVFDLGETTLVPIIPMGPLGALAPVLALPGQMAQSFTNLLPPGSILAQMSQNATNTISALTNLNTTLNPAVTFEGLIPAVNFGPGLQLVFDSIGAPGNALAALNSSGVAFTVAVQAGNPSAAAAALLDAPANMTNGFLNGSTLITLPTVDAALEGAIPVTTTTEIPLGGLLTPVSLPTLNVNFEGSILPPLQVPGSSEIGGLIPGLQNIGSQLAADITPIT